MEEIASLWSYQENIDELKHKLFYTSLELEKVKAETDEKMKRNNESMKQLLQLLNLTCQERDEARDQLQKLLNKLIATTDQQVFDSANLFVANCFSNDQVQTHHQGPLITAPHKANSSITDQSNSFSETHNRSSSPVNSLFDPISSPEFSTPFVQDYPLSGILSNSLCASTTMDDQASLMMEGMIKGKTLPQKGKLLQAVMEAGPLLQSLLVAGPLPRWRNPPPLQTSHIPPMVVTVDQMAAAQKQSIGNPNMLLKSPTMMLKQSQPYVEMACGSSCQMTAAGSGGGGGGGGVLSFCDGNFGCIDGRNFGTIGKRQRLH